MAARKQPFFYITKRFSTSGIYKYKDGHKRLSGAVDICVFLEVSLFSTINAYLYLTYKTPRKMVKVSKRCFYLKYKLV